MSGRIRIEVAYALPEAQEVIGLELEAPCTLDEAVRRSGILERHPEIDLERQHSLGVFGQRRPPGWLLEEGDRVEIYRPLRLSPVEARRLRAEQGRRGKGAPGA